MTLRLRTLIDERFTTLNQEFTFEQLDENFIVLLDEILQGGAANIAQFDPAKEYEPGIAPLFVGFEGNIYENVAEAPHTNVIPGTDPLIWDLSSEGALSHEQNTDYKVGYHPGVIDVTADGELDLTTFDVREKNVFFLLPDANRTITTIKTFDTGISVDYEYYFFVISGSGFSVIFEDSANMQLGNVDLNLGNNDFAKFRTINAINFLIATNTIAGGVSGHTLQEPDGTPLTQREKLRAVSPLQFTNPIGEDFSELGIDPAEELEGLELDQTTPQTVTGGKPIFDEGIEAAALILGYVEKNANYTISIDDYTINCIENSFTVTLLSSVEGQPYNIKNSGNGTIIVNTSDSQLIDGQLTQTLNQFDSMKVQGTGSGWIII